VPGGNAGANTGGGGGGGSHYNANNKGGDGGSGIVIVRYPIGTWSSSNTAVATVNSSGVVTGVSAGTTNINYTVGSGACANTVSRSVTVYNTFAAGAVQADQTVCPSTGPVAFTSVSPAIGGNSVYTYTWQSSTDNVNFTDIAGANSETYTPPNTVGVTYYRREVSETSGCNTPVYTGQAQGIAWTGIGGGATVVGTTITKTGGVANDWSTGAYSLQKVSSGGYVEFRAGENGTYKMMGLNSDPGTDNSYCSLDYSWYPHAGNVACIYENCGNPYCGPAYGPSDVFRVEWNASTNRIDYKMNGTVYYTSTIVPTTPLYVDLSLYTSGASFTNVVVQGDDNNMVTVNSPSTTPVIATANPASVCTAGSTTLTVGVPAALHGGLLDYTTWAAGNSSASGFSPNQDASGENALINSTDPWGNSKVIWEGRASGNNNADGGWNTSAYNIDNTKTYRVSVWVKRPTATSGGTFYFGCNGYPTEVLRTDGGAAGNPYWDCSSSGNLAQNQWYLVVGYVYPYTYSSSTPNTESGLYTTTSGKIANNDGCNIAAMDLKFTSSTTQLAERNYLYYSADATTRLQWAYPRIDLVDGTQPTITQLLSGFDSNNGLGSGASWKWYSGSCGGSLVGTGQSVSVSPSASNTYFVRAEGTCNTTGCGSVRVPVETPPTPTITPSGSTTICAGNSVNLTASDNVAGSALSFNGTGQNVNVGNPSDLQITGNQTIEMWLKPNDFNFRYNPYNKAYAGEGTITQEPNGTLSYYYGTDGTNGSTYQGHSSGVITLNQWNHVALVRDLTNMQLKWYINGVLSSTVAASFPAAVAGSNAVTIGVGYASGQGYNGLIDEVRVWNVARTQAQIQAAMNTTVAPGTAGLKGYWRFDEGSGSITNSMGSLTAAHSLAGPPAWVTSGAPIQPAFTWSPSTGLNTTTGATVTASPGATTTYTATATSPTGCTSTNTITVTVSAIPAPQVAGNVTVGPVPTFGGTALLPDANMTASSNCCGNHEAYKGRLFNPGYGSVQCWASANPTNYGNEYLQIDLGSVKPVNGIYTQGRGDCCSQWVTSYTVQVSNNGSSWSSVGGTYTGNSDAQSLVTNLFATAVNARYVRIIPQGMNNHMSMRADVISIPCGSSQAVNASAELTSCASGIRWYDASSGGNLLGTGMFLTQTISTNTTVWAEAYNGTAVSSRTAVVLKVNKTPTSTVGVTNVTCNGSNNGIVSANVTGATPPYTYAWSSGQTTQVVSALAPNTYTVTVTSLACTASASGNVTQPTVISVTPTPVNEACPGSCSGAVSIAVTGGTPSTTQPNAVTGLVDWTNGDNGVLRDISGLVYQWSDISGSSNNITQASAGNSPTWLSGQVNGRPVVRFNTSQFMTTATNFSTATYTYLTVSRMTGGANGRLLSSASTNWLLGYHGGTMDDLYCNGWVNDGATGANTNVHMYTVTGTGAVSSFYDFGSLIASNANGVAPPGQLQFNGWSNGLNEMSNGDVLEVIVYNRVLSAAELQGVSQYLATKYAISAPATPAYTYNWSNSATTQNISGLCAATYTVTVTDANKCSATASSVVATSLANNTVTASTPQTRCLNTALSPNLTHTTTGATGIGAPTGLPAGVTATWASNTITISGSPTAVGTFNYSIPLTGGCGTVNATGTITVPANNTVTAASSSPAVCINTLMTSITHTTTGATGIGAPTSLPAGVTAAWASNTITISGTPTASGTFNYSIPLTGGCGTVNATGTITVGPNNTATAASSNPTLCINTALSPNITFNTTGATGIGTPTGLPGGLTAAWASNTITISGTPTAAGTFNYTIPLTSIVGGCGTASVTGTITVTGVQTTTVASSSPTLCINTVISPNITHTTTVATGIGSATGLPAGVTAAWASNTISISGTPTVAGTFNYSIPLTGGCGTVNATGTITVTAANTASAASSSPTLCSSTPLTNIT
jgi:hypothetical protein